MISKKNLLGWFLDCCEQGPISTLGFGQPEYLAGGRRLFRFEGVTYTMVKVFSNLFRLCGCKTKITSSFGKPALIIKAENDLHFSLARKTMIYLTSKLNPNVVYKVMLRHKFNGKSLFGEAEKKIKTGARKLKIQSYSLV